MAGVGKSGGTNPKETKEKRNEEHSRAGVFLVIEAVPVCIRQPGLQPQG